MEVGGWGGAASGNAVAVVVRGDRVLVVVVVVALPPPREKNFTIRLPAVPLTIVDVVAAVPDAKETVSSSAPEGSAWWDDKCLLRNFLTRRSGTVHWGLCSNKEECKSLVVAGVVFCCRGVVI